MNQTNKLVAENNNLKELHISIKFLNFLENFFEMFATKFLFFLNVLDKKSKDSTESQVSQFFKIFENLFQKMALVRVGEKEWGVFYEGDSYIVICIKESRGRQLSFNIHFWLGKNTSVVRQSRAANTTIIDK